MLSPRLNMTTMQGFLRWTKVILGNERVVRIKNEFFRNGNIKPRD